MMVGKKFGTPSRIRIIAICVIIVTVLFIVRLYEIIVIKGADYTARADHQYVIAGSSLFDRGDIFLTGKDGTFVSAATQDSGFILAINPTQLKDPEVAYQKINALLPLDKTEFLSHAQKEKDTYEEIAHRVDETVGKNIQALAIPGVNVYRERWRFYPGGNLAAQTIGFLGYASDGSSVTGQYGLERFYEDTLARGNANLYVNFFAEIFANVQHALNQNAADQGDVITSIEPSVQLYLQKELTAYSEKWHPESVGGIIMNPQDGSIYAMAVDPTFDINNFQKSNPAYFKNPLVENVYELGSIMKPITMASGIDSGVITADTTYTDTGCITVNTAKICNYDHKARGVIPMQQILSQSLNVGASYIATKMGKDTYRTYLQKFGITEETGIDLPNEAQPLMNNLKSPRDVEYDTASFGQGIALTPMSMARALAVLGNGGVLVTPHVATEIRYPSGVVKKLGWSPRTQVISPQSAEIVTRMLVSVVDLSLSNGAAKIPGYSVAAKTGTAQIVNPAGGGYYTDRYLHSFFGYFPAYNAKFIVFFFALKPVGAQYASETWTQPFLETTKFLINYYDVPPDRPVAVAH